MNTTYKDYVLTGSVYHLRCSCSSYKPEHVSVKRARVWVACTRMKYISYKLREESKKTNSHECLSAFSFCSKSSFIMIGHCVHENKKGYTIKILTIYYRRRVQIFFVWLYIIDAGSEYSSYEVAALSCVRFGIFGANAMVCIVLSLMWYSMVAPFALWQSNIRTIPGFHVNLEYTFGTGQKQSLYIQYICGETKRIWNILSEKI